jgi:hypothetical protein
MVYTIIFLIANTVVNIYTAVQYFGMEQGAYGAGVIVMAIIYLRE